MSVNISNSNNRRLQRHRPPHHLLLIVASKYCPIPEVCLFSCLLLFCLLFPLFNRPLLKLFVFFSSSSSCTNSKTIIYWFYAAVTAFAKRMAMYANADIPLLLFFLKNQKKKREKRKLIIIWSYRYRDPFLRCRHKNFLNRVTWNHLFGQCGWILFFLQICFFPSFHFAFFRFFCTFCH